MASLADIFRETAAPPVDLTPPDPMRKDWLGALRQALPGVAARKRVSDFQPGTPSPTLLHDVGQGYGGSLGGLFADAISPPDLHTGDPFQEGRDFAAQLGTFGGKLAKTADLEALARAQQMEAAGGLKHTIYDATGWFKSPDNQWRFEIPDQGAVIDSKAAMDKRVAFHNQVQSEAELASILAHRAAAKGIPIDEAAAHLTNELQRPIPANSIQLAKENTKESLLARAKYLEGYDPTAEPLTVDEVVTHPELKAAYPDLFSRPYHRQGGADAMFWHGAYAPGTDEFYFSKHSPASMEPSTGLHELNHGVQAREGFAPGANMGDYSPASVLKYKNSLGEVESRNVEIRKGFTPLQRKTRYPWMTQDVKPKDVFVMPADPFTPKP